MKKPELLAPAGDLERLKVAVLYGADAIFLGGENYGLRSGASNFTYNDIKEGCEFAKKYNVKIYVTTNIFPHVEDYEGFLYFLKKIESFGVKGIIVSDPGYIEIAKENTNLEIHISTQQSIMNHRSVNFFKKLGANRVVLGRELDKFEIKNIIDSTDLEVEIFIHGAVCSSYSGRCTLSNHMTLRDSNRGGCCQSCRWNYDLFENDNNLSKNQTKFNMSAKDMNLLANIPDIINLGASSLKIEGRMKSLHYVATVIKVYREAIDNYFEDPKKYELKPEWINELKKAESRSSSQGYFEQIYDEKAQIFNSQYQSKKIEYCGDVLSFDVDTNMVVVKQKNFFQIGDTLEIIGPKTKPIQFKIEQMYNEEGNLIEKANHPLMLVKFKFNTKIEKYHILRKVI